MTITTVDSLQTRMQHTTAEATKHDPTWLNENEVISINHDIISVDETDYPFPIEFWDQSSDEIAATLTEYRCYKQAKHQFDNGGMKYTKARVEEIKRKYNYRVDVSLDDNR